MIRSLTLASVLCAFGCSVVFDGDRHTGNPPPVEDGGPPPDAGAQPVASSDACNRFANVICEAVLRCCSVQRDGCVGREETCLRDCVNAYQTTCLETIVPFTTDPIAGYDPQIAGQVLWDLAGGAASCDPRVVEIFAYDYIDIPPGSLSAGDTRCDPLDGLEFDVVRALYCEGDLECVSNGGLFGTWMCGAQRAAGEPCVTYLECQDGLGCGVGGVCGARQPAGGPCRLAGDCVSAICVGADAMPGRCLELNEYNAYCVSLGGAEPTDM